MQGDARNSPAKFKKIFRTGCVVEGEEVLTLTFEDENSQKLFVDTSRIPKEKWNRF